MIAQRLALPRVLQKAFCVSHSECLTPLNGTTASKRHLCRVDLCLRWTSALTEPRGEPRVRIRIALPTSGSCSQDSRHSTRAKDPRCLPRCARKVARLRVRRIQRPPRTNQKLNEYKEYPVGRFACLQPQPQTRVW